MHPKDKTPILDQCGLIYKIPCKNCDNFYVGETGRSLSTRLHEHQTKKSSAVFEHNKKEKHDIDINKIKVLTKEEKYINRRIKEAVIIRQTDPPLNRDDGYKLPVIYNSLMSCNRQLHDESCDVMSHD